MNLGCVWIAVAMLLVSPARGDSLVRTSPEVPFDHVELEAAIAARTDDPVRTAVSVRVDGGELVFATATKTVRIQLAGRARAAVLRLAAIIIVEQLLAEVEPTTTLPPGVTELAQPGQPRRFVSIDLVPQIHRGLGDRDSANYGAALGASLGGTRNGLGITVGAAYMPTTELGVSQRTLSLGVFGGLRSESAEARVNATLHRYTIGDSTGAESAHLVPSVGGTASVRFYSGRAFHAFGLAGVQVFARRVRILSPILESTLHTTAQLEMSLGVGIGWKAGL